MSNLQAILAILWFSFVVVPFISWVSDPDDDRLGYWRRLAIGWAGVLLVATVVGSVSAFVIALISLRG